MEYEKKEGASDRSRLTEEKTKERAERYIEKRTQGLKARDAARQAGYSDLTRIDQIERIGGPVATRMAQALQKKGIDEDYVAGKYKEYLDLCKEDGAKQKDLNAASQLLRNLGFLLGYGTKGPQVAVQINNNQGRSEEDDPAGVRDLAEQIGELVKMVKTEVSNRDASSLPPGDTGTGHSQAHQGVVELTPEEQEDGSGGES